MKTIKKYPYVCKGVSQIIHGADYNPDQWLEYPDILNEDIRLMKLAGINSVTLGIFAWSALEPEEGIYTFEWLDEILDKLHQKGISVILATPSGARPAWMDKKYPEVLRTMADRKKRLHGRRHNHCFSSPYYLGKVRQINTMLAMRYKDHPALSMWHISNEYSGECHCEYCQAAFRNWLKEKYNYSIKQLNHEWWTAFWSHTYTCFEEIEAPSSIGEDALHGLYLDWKRFVTDQTIQFMKNEIAPLKEITPQVPVTTNMMGTDTCLNYWEVAKHIDVASWDNYPKWHSDEMDTIRLASDTAFVHDINRNLKGGRPFMMMESTPSQVNWQKVNKLKRPKIHTLSSLQAIAHGSDTVQYFQWRKSRGSSEKLHGAVVDHCGHERTRVFKEVSELGEILKKLNGIVGTSVRPDIAIIYDWENRWIIDNVQGFNDRRHYEQTCKDHYYAFWKRGVPVDVIEMNSEYRDYQLVIAPMLYMLKPGVGERLKGFVENGGNLVLTYGTGYANENDLCFLGGFPGDGLMEVAGIWSEEIDPLYESDENQIIYTENSLKLEGSYRAHTLCEIIHTNKQCEVLATYGQDFYQGMPAITKNKYGKGNCYYIATRTDEDMLEKFYKAITTDIGIKGVLPTDVPRGVSIQTRHGDGEEYLFIMNFTEESKEVTLPKEDEYLNLLSLEEERERSKLEGYDVKILRTKPRKGQSDE